MTAARPEHLFDRDAAERFRPIADFVKTAIMVEPVEPVTVLRTPFGEQTMRGDFYLVADGDGSYGAARAEFEAMHESVGPQQWVKRAEVLAYRATEPSTVVTTIDGEVEGRVVARPGDWIVQQIGGEVMVVESDEFAARYRVIGD